MARPTIDGVAVGSRDPTKPAAWTIDDVNAIQALQAGTANAPQQQRALRWIVEAAAGTYDLSYRTGDPTATAFAEGKRAVGLQIVKLCRLLPNAVREAEDRHEQQVLKRRRRTGHERTDGD